MEVIDEPTSFLLSDWIRGTQPIGTEKQWQPGDPPDAPNKRRGEHLFAPPPLGPFGPCSPPARAASDGAESDRNYRPIPKPTAATELRKRAPPSSSPAHCKSPKLASSSASSTTSLRSASSSVLRSFRPPRLVGWSSPLSPPSTPRSSRGAPLRHRVPSATLSPLPSSATMMEVNVVPSVVLHFHGFRSSLVSNLADAAYRIAIDMAQRSLAFSAKATATMLVLILVEAAIRKLSQGLVVYAAFLACETLAVKYGNKQSTFLFGNAVEISLAPRAVAPPPTLPRLQLPASIAMLPKAPSQDAKIDVKQVEGDAAQLAPSILATPQPARQLSAVRRRLATQMRAPFPGVNAVLRERRRRADVTLHDAKIRVGKAFVDPAMSVAVAGGDAKPQKPVDTYMVRIDCSKPDDKHMNPVVMWDVTATFDEFRKLEKDLRREVKTKRLRNVNVPHLATGAILFVQPELTQDVLAKRRTRLQAFIDALRCDRVLADCDAMRKFCQAV